MAKNKESFVEPSWTSLPTRWDETTSSALPWLRTHLSMSTIFPELDEKNKVYFEIEFIAQKHPLYSYKTTPQGGIQFCYYEPGGNRKKKVTVKSNKTGEVDLNLLISKIESVRETYRKLLQNTSKAKLLAQAIENKLKTDRERIVTQLNSMGVSSYIGSATSPCISAEYNNMRIGFKFTHTTAQDYSFATAFWEIEIKFSGSIKSDTIPNFIGLKNQIDKWISSDLISIELGKD